MLFIVNKIKRTAAGPSVLLYVTFQLLGRELVNRLGLVGVAGFEQRRCKGRFVGRIREVLRLKAESAAAAEHLSVASERAVQEVASVELESGFHRVNFEHAAGRGFVCGGRQGEGAVRGAERPVVVVAVTQLDLRIIVLDVRTDGRGLGEVHGRARHVDQLAGRNQRAVDFGELVGENRRCCWRGWPTG